MSGHNSSDLVERSLSPGDMIPLPEPLKELLAAPGGDSLAFEKTYFDPEKWDAEMSNRFQGDERDPVKFDLGKCEGQAAAALIVSDFHLADGTPGGDDFLESHILPDDDLNGLYTGFFPPGESRARLFTQVMTFALRRVAGRAGNGTRLELVLNGDVINGLELKGRGGTVVSAKHKPLFRALAAVRDRADVFWLRGNHDYIVPSGAWRAGQFYANKVLRLLAEHGDFWDKENWPPGADNKGSKLAIEAASAFEVHPAIMKDGSIKYLISGIDNLRPWNNDAIEAFLDRRSKYSDVAMASAVLARLKSLGAADDSEAYKGAQERRTGQYRDWTMVQGHTHVPAQVPGAYYNTGTWITTLVAPKGKEKHVEMFPFLLVYLDKAGKRVEEYFFVDRSGQDQPARATLQSPESVNEFRGTLGYKPVTA